MHQALQAVVAALPSTTPDPRLKEFTCQFYRSLSLGDLQEMDTALAANIAAHAFAAYRKRSQPGAAITITAPDYLSDHFGRRRLAVTVVNRDMPFLVDSLSMSLHALGFTMYRTIHPQLWALRDEKGELTACAHAPFATAAAESCMYVELSPLPEGMETAVIHARLSDALAHVQYAVEDWRVMMAKLREMGTHIAGGGTFLSHAQMEEASAFLDWLLRNNFIFLGFASYDFYDAQGKECLKPVAGSELGVFRLNHEELQSRGLAGLPPEVQHFVHQAEPIEITKSNRHSVMHRDVLMDYVGVKRYDASGKVIGESRFLGLFTSSVYYQNTHEIPYIRSKVARVMEEAGFDRAGHSGKVLRATLEFFPRDELFQIGFEELLEMTLGIVSLEERPGVRAFFRRDRFERFVSCFVYMPRDKFNTYVREEVAKVLERHLNGSLSTFYSQLTDSPLARVNYIIQTTPGHIPPLDMAVLNAELGFIINYWVDSLQERLSDMLGEQRGEKLFRQFSTAFGKSYINTTQVDDAIADIQRLVTVMESRIPSFTLLNAGQAEGWRLKMYAHASDIALSDILPMIENLGFKVRDVIPYAVTPTLGGSEAHALLIRDFTVLPQAAGTVNFDHAKPLIEEALRAIWQQEVANDGLNALVTLAGLNVRQVMLLRAYLRYGTQAGLPYSEAYIIQALRRHAEVAAFLVRLFEARFDPAQENGREARVTECHAAIAQALLQVENLSEDRILRFFADTIQASLRTNYYQRVGEAPKPYLSFKLDSGLVPNLPLPKPWREIFVYSMTTEGIHLRGGKVARGGLRWSDRQEDFRTEVLGLMKAQIVKNTVIVPTGSKGGFVVKGDTGALNREEKQAAGIASYRQFLHGLLDITDNRVAGQVVPPAETVRYDEDDPYLVVAADKGTATFSDIANGVSAEYRFWLGDAFASGGSVGYDHKKMGITAKGAWISVTGHFSDIGRDIAAEDFTVAGIGDMSGDVFGNGMLLSRHIRLQAAFNHLHIFFDPSPDAAGSFTERERLFILARGSWDAYDASLISKGGGVFARSSKTIPLSAELQQLLGVKDKTLPPNEVIRLILKLPVDLLWNGGIGTYVKASAESHEEVGDPGNNGVRVSADELRCRVIGEGGNLGMTQRARTEYARAGGKLNTDAIDNSAGVDCSDHEVNIKIAMRLIEEQTAMPVAERNRILESMTEQVGALVLQDNRQQNRALSIAERRGTEMVEMHGQFIRTLEQDGLLNRAVEFLPSDKQLADLKAGGLGLTRPELSVLLAYSKIKLYQTLADSKLVDSDVFVSELLAYFPPLLKQRFAETLLIHPLRREIVATMLTNEIVNRAGITYILSLHKDTGHHICNIVRIYVVVREIFSLSALWQGIESLEGSIPAELQLNLLMRLTRFLRRLSVWFLAHTEQPVVMETVIAQYRASIEAFVRDYREIVSPADLEANLQDRTSLQTAGVPEDVARQLANLDFFLSACDIAMLDHASSHSLQPIGRLYYALGERLQLGWLHQFITTFSARNYWDRLALRNAIGELHDEQRRLSESVLADMQTEEEPAAALTRWLEAHGPEVARFERLMYDIRAAEKQDLSMMIVALRQLAAIRGK